MVWRGRSRNEENPTKNNFLFIIVFLEKRVLNNPQLFIKTSWSTIYFFIGNPNFDSWTKELSFCHKFWFSNPYTFLTWWCKESGIVKSEIVAKTQIHSVYFLGFPTHVDFLNCGLCNFLEILRDSIQYENSCEQFRTVSCNSTQLNSIGHP